MKPQIEALCIAPAATLLQAIRQMDEVRRKLLLVMDGGRFAGVLSIGDIQRAIIRNLPMTTAVGAVLRREITVGRVSDSRESIRQLMLAHRAEFMPVLDADGALAEVLFWSDFFGAPQRPDRALGLPVVIMAGGEGRRLQPLTYVLPKPLLPIGRKTILEHIMDWFAEYGCCEFHLSVNYRADMIRSYLLQHGDPRYRIDCFQEERPLGTAGSLHLVRDRIDRTFFVSNCDILIDQDLAAILDYHRENRNELTAVAALKHVPLAYGILQTGPDGILTGFQEKPEFVFQINSGVYVLEPHLLREIPANAFFHITQLVEAILARHGRVGVFPVSEGSWTDIGNWDDYRRAMGTGA